MSGAGRPAAIDGLREIADRFDHLLIDQYGVLHDGRRAFPDGPDEADFLLLAGLDDAAADPALWRKRLAGAAARGVPLICANPDVAMFGATGLLPGPGAVAAAYAEIGGPVHLIGKPEGLIYACCLAELGQPDPGRVLAVGDSLDHDVLGGNRAGLLTVLVAGGILAGTLGRAPSRAALAW